MKLHRVPLVLFYLFLLRTAAANTFNFNGTELIITHAEHQTAILKIKQTPRVHKYLNSRLKTITEGTVQTNAGVHTRQLGMNNVPVLDQGIHGTCVTFAVSAALDAIIGKGDHISQLCALQLGDYLENNAFADSGWNGSWANKVISQFMTFGYITQTKQRSLICGSKEYPANSEPPKSNLDIQTYHAYTEPPLSSINIDYSSLLDVNQRIYDDENTYILLNKIKTALDLGDRLTFGVVLADLQYGVAGAVGNHHTTNDSWIVTPDITQDVQNGTASYGMHEMLITGYDDNAIAKDAAGHLHYGLLTLRNSWGAEAGDHGNFYMSYDYFKAFVLEAYRIRQLPAAL